MKKNYLLTKKLIKNSMIVAVLVLLLSVIMFVGVLYTHFTSQLMDELVNEVNLVAQGVELQGEKYLGSVITNNRITWIESDGTVIYDSTVAASELENHSDREEIQEAIANASGTAKRYSSTLSEQTLYATKRLEDGSVIRMSSAQSTVVSLLVNMAQPIIIILLISIISSITLANKMAKKIIDPIVALDLEHPEICETYDELYPLLSRIKEQNDTINEQMLKLKQRKREFKTLTENMSEGFLLLDKSGNVLSYNMGAVQLLGTVVPSGEVNALTLNRSESFRKGLEELLSGQKSRQMLHINGRYCQMLANPIMQGGESVGGVIVLLDVTEQEKRDELRREFTANVSHELKTPLTSISGIAEIIKSGMVRPEDIQGFAEDIYKEAGRLIGLVQDIMSLSELDEGGANLEREHVELLSLSKEITKRLESKAQKRQVKVIVSGKTARVYGVRRVLDEIIYNLCENAIKYNRPNGTVKVNIGFSGLAPKITVTDTGIGIPKEDCDRVFERFYRVDKSHSGEVSGTGLGLSIVKHGAQLHGAEIILDSEKDKGTSISLIFNGNNK